LSAEDLMHEASYIVSHSVMKIPDISLTKSLTENAVSE